MKNKNETATRADFINEQEPSQPAVKKTNKVLLAAIALFCAFVLFFSGFFAGSCSDPAARKAKEIINLIDKYSAAVEGDADKDDVARAIVAYVLKDDKYAKYYGKEEYAAALREDQGLYAGVGFSFLVDPTGKVTGNTVYQVQRNSSAYHAGVKSGDKIIAAKVLTDGERTDFEDNAALYDFLTTAPKDTDIAFYITRDGEFTEKEFVLVKEYYTACYAGYKDNAEELYFYSEHGAKTEARVSAGGESSLPEDTAIISLYGFEGDAAREFSSALAFMKKKGKTKLILDLRDNGGGFMTTLAEIASYLVYNDGNKKSLIAVAKDKRGKRTEFYTPRNEFFDNVKKICVIANENTASASECLIGALLYYGKTAGRAEFSSDELVLTYNRSRGDYSTYGKGIMQTTYELPSGGAFKLTTAYIYQPDGKTCIHDKGIATELPANRVEDSDALKRAVEICKSV